MSCRYNTPLLQLMSKLAEEQGGPTESVILCGIETQACIYHTVMDLLERGDINVHVVADCCSSRKGRFQILNDLTLLEAFWYIPVLGMKL